MASQSFHRRELPSSCVDFSSDAGKLIFREALLDGLMENYFIISPQFSTQAEPAYCGLTTLSIALNALGVDPHRVWKGVWRWFSEELLDCCAPLEEVAKTGIDMNTFACLARCNGAAAKVTHADSCTDAKGGDETECDSLKAFREVVVDVCSSPASKSVLVVAYHRGALKQTGAGHFSPIGGYHRASDKVLLMDVARFKYPPHWVSLRDLWRAMADFTDPATGRTRGYILLQRNDLRPLVAFRVPAYLSCIASASRSQTGAGSHSVSSCAGARGSIDGCCDGDDGVDAAKQKNCCSAGVGVEALFTLFEALETLRPPYDSDDAVVHGSYDSKDAVAYDRNAAIELQAFMRVCDGVCASHSFPLELLVRDEAKLVPESDAAAVISGIQSTPLYAMVKQQMCREMKEDGISLTESDSKATIKSLPKEDCTTKAVLMTALLLSLNYATGEENNVDCTHHGTL